MKHNIITTTALILLVALCLNVPLSVSASEYTKQAPEITAENATVDHDNTQTTAISDADAKGFEVYGIDLENQVTPFSSGTGNIVNTILSQCERISDYYLDDIHIQKFVSETLANHLYKCNNIEEIALIDDILYITYNTDDGVEVYISYDENNNVSRFLYFPETDTAISQMSGAETLQYDGFRKGCSTEISPEALEALDNAINEQKWEEVERLVALINGEPGSERSYSLDAPSLKAPAHKLYGFTSDEAMLNNLRNNFKEENNRISLSKSINSEIIHRSCPARVTHTQTDYVRITSDWKSYVAKTAISTIASYLHLHPTKTAEIVKSVGISLIKSGADELIAEAVTLYRTAKYQFLGARDGYVYDKGGYNQYVHVVFYANKGEFTGGYDPDGTFRWVMSLIPRAYDHSDNEIINDAVRLYADDVFTNGRCATYWPD